MMKNVKTRAKDTRIWDGGICWVPSALLKKEKTTISLRKLVIAKTIEGAKTKSVRTIKRFRLVTRSLGSFGADKERLTVGMVTLSAAKRARDKIAIRKRAFFISNLLLENILDYSKYLLKERLIFPKEGKSFL